MRGLLPQELVGKEQDMQSELLPFFLSAARLPGKEPERCTAKSLGSGKTLAVAEAEDIGKMCEPEETSAQLLPANPFKV